MFKKPAASEKTPAELEKALPELVKKLQHFKGSLSPDEAKVFEEIVTSASLHTKYVQSHDEGHQELVYVKPMSVHSTAAMKNEFAKLPETLNIKATETPEPK